MSVIEQLITQYMRFGTHPLFPISAECPAEGQEYYDGVNTCVPCTGTCEEPDIACYTVCRSGCGCPVGTVLDEEANACVNVTDCPKGESCECHMNITLPPDGEICRVSVLITKTYMEVQYCPTIPPLCRVHS